MPPRVIGAGTSAPSTVTPIMSRLVPESSTSSGIADGAGEHPEDMASHLPVSGKGTKRQSKRGGKEDHAARTAFEHARVRPKKRKRALNAKPKSFVNHHIRNGQIVAVDPDQELTPEPRSQVQALVVPSAPEPSVRAEEADQDSRTVSRICHRKGRDNQAVKAPLSSPAKPSHSSPRNACCVRSSPTKEEVWNTISQTGGVWPELPSAFSHWDVQVCF